MRVLSICAAILSITASVGCRYDPKKAPPLKHEYIAGDSFVLSNEQGRLSGTVVVEESSGVPRLTVDVHGE